MQTVVRTLTLGVKNLLYLGSSCRYPRASTQPMTEDLVVTEGLEPTNEAYVVAKDAGIKLCQRYHTQCGDGFISAVPVNLYGPGDDSGLTSSHVVNLAQDIRSTYEWFLRNQDALCLSGPTPTGGQREPADERAGR